jgi:hypothetical protein
MPFLKRLGYFLVGLSLGLVFLAFFLRKKTDETGAEFCYLPNCRVLKDLRSKPMQIDPSLQGTVDTLLIQEILKEGKVDFSASDTKAIPCKTYRVKLKKKEGGVEITVDNCASHVLLTAYEPQ